MKSNKDKGLPPKRGYNNLSRAMKAAAVEPVSGRRKGAWELERDTRVVGAPKDINRKPGHKKLDLPESAIVSMAHDKAAGMSDPAIAAKYHVSDAYVSESLKRLYVNTKVGREILKGVLLENAIATGMHARKQINTMNGMQAAVATGIFTDRFVQLDKHMASQPIEIDFNELQQVGGDLRKLRELVGGITDREVPSIDIEAEVSSDDGD